MTTLVERITKEVNDCLSEGKFMEDGTNRFGSEVAYCTYFEPSNSSQPVYCPLLGSQTEIMQGDGVNAHYMPFNKCHRLPLMRWYKKHGKKI